MQRRAAGLVGWAVTLVLTTGVVTVTGGWLAPARERGALAARPAVTSVVTTRRVAVPPAALRPVGWAATTAAPSLVTYTAPGGPAFTTLTNPTWKGAPLVLLVVGRRVVTGAAWWKVLLAVRPNGTSAWVPAAKVRLVPEYYWIEVVEHLHLLKLWHGTQLLYTWPVAVGRPSAPTPTGTFFVDVLIRTYDPTGPYGPAIVGTSGFSDVYATFDGGLPLIGIHGTDEPWVIGTSYSHGCVRLHDPDAAILASLVPLGTPIRILP